jgi:prophage tail gpP-like protein
MKPVVITIGGSSLENYTEMTLTRTKDEMTGTLEVTIFGGGVPPSPILRGATVGAEIQVYIGGQMAFTGSLDKRSGTGAKKGKDPEGGTDTENQETKGDSSMTTNIGPNEYTIKLSARGKTKRLIDSSHQHETTNMMQPTTKDVVDKLVKPFKTQVEWKGETIKLDKARFRDGARVVDELHRVALENCYFMYETRDGKLRVTDGVGSDSGGGGDPLILGQNILTFSAEQSEDEAKSKVKVKGQRSKKDMRGKKALEKTFKEVKDGWVKDFVPETVQHNGDADDKTLERRARFEMNKHAAASKKITIEVFHVVSQMSGQPWDVGNTHYVEVPPEGIFDVFECTGLEFHVDATKTLKTTLTLSPPPSGGAGGGGGGGYQGGSGGFGLDKINMNVGAARRSQAGIEVKVGSYPEPWIPAQLSNLPLQTLVEAALQPPPKEEEKRPPPLTLPPWWGQEET